MIQATKFATKKWYVIDRQTAKDKYNQNNSIKFKTESIKSSLCDYSGAFILGAGDLTVNADNDTDIAFKNCAPFSTCHAEINDVFIDEANHIYIAMPMYNLIEYSDNYSDTSGSLWQFKRDEVPNKNADLIADNSRSFKYKSALAVKTANAVNSTNSSVKKNQDCCSIKVSKQLLEKLAISLINCKIHLELNWIEDCILSSAEDSEKLKITDAKLPVPIVTLSTKEQNNYAMDLEDLRIGTIIKLFLQK